MTTQLADIMDAALTLHVSTSVRDALDELVDDQREFALVVDDGLRPIGYVTSDLITIAALGRGRNTPLSDLSVRAAMRATLPLPHDTPLQEARALLRDWMPCIAVTDSCGSAIGVASARSMCSEEDAPVVPRLKRVMVVDDDIAVLESLVQLLEEEGFYVAAALDGRHALEILAAIDELPGLILLDLMMPYMNGWEFRREQLQHVQVREIPVVVLTAHGKFLEHEELELHRPAAVLEKPFEVDELLATVNAHFTYYVR